ncbi:hypothetical protein Sango_3004500 [Sesamum angolense]|uniref:Reverse transcriptase domain-containing protein n=1 Tax=Sesamum angolense TaxID=2727404 RepID=A0AAE1T1E1_9LAMI|nr:hypothetical protein Sango_3004500 [Sesamum angolense]
MMRLGLLFILLPSKKLKQLSLILRKTKPLGQMDSPRVFKAAWPVVGEEVSKAIIDFFKTGRLLKQLNATLLTLIPKISDNILLAQEIFSGYNQCRLPPRCALKVDIRKAYDTVEWDCLIATLRMFGFPELFIRWIDECVTQHITRNLLSMTGNFSTTEMPGLKLFQLSFADDLLLMYCQPLLLKIDSRIKGWEGVQLSFAGRVQLIKSVLISFEVYWAMAFILPKGIIKEMIKRLRTFLWKGNSANGYSKVAWEAVCRPIEEGGLAIKDILALNRALMFKENKGVWGWRKMLSLRHYLRSHIQYSVGNGDSILLWHDLWHSLGPLISRFPRGPQLTRTGLLDKLSVVIKDRQWNWPLITDIACLEITHMLPPILEGPDKICWKTKEDPSNPRQRMIFFTHQDLRCSGPLLKGSCIMCQDGIPETHDHLFLHAPFPAVALPLSDSRSHFHGPTGIGNLGFNGRHPDGVERNARRFQQRSRPPSIVASLLWKRLDSGSLVSLYDILFPHLVFVDYGKSLGLWKGFPSDMF